MKNNCKKITFIWDLDGTLLDSYPLIVNSLYTIYKEKGVLIDKNEIYKQKTIKHHIKRKIISKKTAMSDNKVCFFM